MSRFLFTILLSLICFSLQADNVPTKDPETEEEQETCVQQRLKICLSKCTDTSLTNCAKLCNENVKNECREAGV